MALIYIYDATELDKQQISDGLVESDHNWQFVEDSINIKNINPDTEVISVFVSSVVTKEIINALPKLKLIACRSTGYNNVDIEAAEEHGVSVVNVPTYGESTVAEYAFTLLLALARKLPLTLKTFDNEIESEELMGTDLTNKCFGVVGAGRIGQHSIAIAKGFRMKVLAYDPFPNDKLADQLNFQYVSLNELLRQSDFVTIHAPFVGSNKHLINEDNLRFMKSSALLINTARGELVDTRALAEALEEKRIAGAALDVLEGEQLLHVNEEMELLRSGKKSLDLMQHSVELLALHKMSNVIITPHNAYNSLEAVHRINRTTAENIINYWYGDLKNKVQIPKKSKGKLLLVRHAESEWNASGKWSGITDVHLSEKGFREAGMFGIALADLGIKIDQAYCSEQIRTLETLEGILNTSQQFDVPIVRSGAINERDYGEYTGKNKWEMRELLGEEQFNAVRRGWDVPIPGGETLKMVYERAVPFFLDQVLPYVNDGKNVLIVAHGNSIRALIKYIEQLNEDRVSRLEMLFGTIIVYDLNDEGVAIKRSDTTIDTTPPNA